jgi:WD40 repeat protein
LQGSAIDRYEETRPAGPRPAGVSRELDAAVVRVWSSAGEVVGSGFLVDPSHVVTCAHVVTAALRRATSDESGFPNTLNIDFPLIAANRLIQAQVEVLHPIEHDDSGDIAVLSVVGEPPVGLIPARLVAASDFWGHPFRAFGFPRRHDYGVWVSGVLRASQGAGWVQMEGAASGYAVEGGFSGGAVWDDDLAGVVGMTVAAESGSGIRTAYLIPADTLMRVWPALAQQTLPPCPYRGLSPFRVQDVAVFFGREDVIERLARDVAHRPILSLVGPSGSGKSSVLFAGLLPKLQQQGWITVSMRPAQAPSPLLSLSGALIEILEPNLSETERIVALHSLADLISAGHFPEVMDRVLTRSRAPVLLAVDQFEELFARDWEDVIQFNRILLSVVQAQPAALEPRVSIVLTLRVDFLNDALHDPALATALENSVVAIGQMGRSNLRSVIEGPLPRGVKYESGLVDRILGDVGEEAGSLPLLEFALTLLWERQEPGVLTHAAYQALGGVKGALAAYAERIFKEQLLPGDWENAHRLFVQLARPSDVGTPVRRVARPLELGQDLWEVAQRLAATRLLVADRDPTGIESVELVHEALITGWERLNNWIQEDRAFRAWQEELRNDLATWNKVNKDSGALLRGAPLAEAERWLSEREKDLGTAEADFVRLSIAQRGRSVRRLRVAVVTLTLLLLSATVLGGVVIWQSNNSRQQALSAGSRNLASQAEALAASDPRTAMILAATAYQAHPTEQAIRTLTKIANENRQIETLLTPDLPAIQSVEFSPSDPNLLAIYGSNDVALWDLRTNSARFRHKFDSQLLTAAFAPDGKALAIEAAESPSRNSLSVWFTPEDRLIELSSIKISSSSYENHSLRFSGDGKILALCKGNRIELWEVETRFLLSRTGIVDSASSNGCGIGFTSKQDLMYLNGGKVVIWNPRTGKVTAENRVPWGPALDDCSGLGERPSIVAVAPNGRIAWLNDGKGHQSWWDVEGRMLRESPWPTAADPCFTDQVQFTADSRLAMIQAREDLLTFDVASGRPLAAYSLPKFGQFSSPSINADGQTVAISTSANSAALMKLSLRPGVPVDTGEIAILSDNPHFVAGLTRDGVAIYSYEPMNGEFEISHQLKVPGYPWPAAQLSPSGHYLAVVNTSSDKRISLFDLNAADLAKPMTLEGHRSSVEQLAFDAESRLLASVDASEIRVWSVAHQSVAARIPLPEGYVVEDLAISPNGRYVGVVDRAGRALMWEVSSLAITELTFKGAQSLTFSQSGNWLSVVTSAGTQLWDMTSKQKLPNDVPMVASYHVGPSTFSADEQYLAIGADDVDFQGAFVWNIPALQLVGSVPAAYPEFVFLPNSQGMLAVGTGSIQVFSFDPKHSLETICRITGNGELSEREWNQYAPGVPKVAACP